MFRSYGAKHERKSQYANLSAYPRSAFTARCRPRRRRLSSNDQKPPALPQTLPTDAASPCCTTTGSLQRVYGLSHAQTHELQREAWPISAHACSYTPAGRRGGCSEVCAEGLHFSAFHFFCSSLFAALFLHPTHVRHGVVVYSQSHL